MIPTTLDSLSKPSDGMHTILFSIDASKLFIKECSLALRESDVLTTDSLATLICYCCWRNQTFSACVIEELQVCIVLFSNDFDLNRLKYILSQLVN
jgi:hypothetical protein